MADLFDTAGVSKRAYTAKDIEVLEGLEPVRKRPGMYIGGTDRKAMHHLAAEALDNAMDEAVAGHASRIEVELNDDGSLSVTDNGRGIPVDKHPKFKTKSALEVIMTTLHSGGKFNQNVYKTSGGLHGVGISVVNALSEWLIVEVARDRKVWQQTFERGKAVSKLREIGAASNRRGTRIQFYPDPKIFGDDPSFSPEALYHLARSKAYLFRGVEIRWKCAKNFLEKDSGVPAEINLHFPGGLAEYLDESLKGKDAVLEESFTGRVAFTNGDGRVEWAVKWLKYDDGFASYYCNTIPNPEGGTHEQGLRGALVRALRHYGELTENRKVKDVTTEDVLSSACIMLSIFIPDPQFQGQTKEKLATPAAAKLVEAAVGDRFDLWLSSSPDRAEILLRAILERTEERLRRRQEKELTRKTAVSARKLRLPGKLTDCTKETPEGTELFIVEGDSAGGSAKQARQRLTQAVLPIRGKILNVASAGREKITANAEVADLIQALGCGTRDTFNLSQLRYERIIIMTDADVDGAHIATLLMTFFFQEMPRLVEEGRLYLAQPPLYRLSQGGAVHYARDDKHKDELMKKVFGGKGKVEISRFKGLGEMPPSQLKETTMDPKARTLLRVRLPEDHKARNQANKLVDDLMGKKPEKRFDFIQANAKFVENLDV
jgi:topoisomerase IV subunit B